MLFPASPTYPPPLCAAFFLFFPFFNYHKIDAVEFLLRSDGVVVVDTLSEEFLEFANFFLTQLPSPSPPSLFRRRGKRFAPRAFDLGSQNRDAT